VVEDGAVRLFKSAEEKQALAEAETAFRHFVGVLSRADPESVRDAVSRLEGTGALETLPARDRRRSGEQAFLVYASNALADDHLTEDEEDALGAVAEAVGFSQEEFSRHELYPRLQVAKLNDGRLPVLDAPQLMTKRGEIVHGEVAAALMKEVAVRQWQGGSQGFSFRVAKGVRYRVGSTRGHMVTVGTQLQVADMGTLSITNQRAVYIGARKTIDMPYAKMVGMQLYTDGISFSLSNRQNAPLLKVAMNTDVLGALLNAAIQAAAE
jgi:hypothetical protein